VWRPRPSQNAEVIFSNRHHARRVVHRVAGRLSVLGFHRGFLLGRRRRHCCSARLAAKAGRVDGAQPPYAVRIDRFPRAKSGTPPSPPLAVMGHDCVYWGMPPSPQTAPCCSPKRHLAAACSPCGRKPAAEQGDQSARGRRGGSTAGYGRQSLVPGGSSVPLPPPQDFARP
jgi:hypothetical protein